MTPTLTLYGAPYSVYVRIVRLVLLEKNIDYRLETVDIFKPDKAVEAYRSIHPFAKIPAINVDGFVLYETGAIVRYLDEIFPEPPLMPDTARERANVNRILSIIDNYAYPSMVWGIYVALREQGESACESDAFNRHCERAETVFCVLDTALEGKAPYLGGHRLSLADLHAVPVLDYFLRTATGQKMVAHHPNVQNWWERIKTQHRFDDILSDDAD